MAERVFVVYADTEQSAYEELEQHLTPMFPAGTAVLRGMRHVPPGEDRRAAIEREIDAAGLILLLLSKDLFASPEIRPHLARAVARGRAGVRVVPIVAHACAWEASELGGVEVLPRTKEPVMTAPDRAKVWKSIVVELRPCIGSGSVHAPADAPPAPPPPNGPPRPPPSPFEILRRRRATEDPLSLPVGQISIELDRRKDRLERRYEIGDSQTGERAVWDGPPCANLRKLGSERRGDKKRYDLELVRWLLESGSPREREAHLTGEGLDAAGELLFQILFGGDSDWAKIAARLHRDDRLRPHGRRARVRVHTEDRELMSLPWRITTWQGHRLIAEREPWTFELAPAAAAGTDTLFAPPGNILVIAPPAADPDLARDLMTDVHVAAMRGVVESVRRGHGARPDGFRVVTTWPEALEAMKARWDMVVCYGQARAAGGQVSLLFGPGERDAISLREIADRAVRVKPCVLFFNAVTAEPGGRALAMHPSPADIPLAVTHVRPGRPEVARAFAIGWLTEVARRGSDPVAAANLHLSPADWLADGPPASHDDACGTLSVTASYRTWRVHGRRPDGEWDHLRKAFDLDRSAQREAFARRMEQLCRKENVNCHALVAYGTRGNHLETLGEQLWRDAEAHFQGRIAVNHIQLQGGDAEAVWTPTALRLLLLEHAHHGVHDTPPAESDMRRLLEHLAPPRLGPGARVILLDLGVIRPPASPERDLPAALTFLRDRVARPVPGERTLRGFHVVGLVAVELAPHDLGPFGERVDDLSGPPWETDYFELSALPEVGRAKRRDVRDFLQRTGCPLDIADEVLALLLDRTGDGKSGEYEGLVAELTFALERGYPALHERLLSWKARP